MYIRKVLHLLGIVIASLALVTMIVIANGNLLSSSFAQGEQNFTANMTDKEEVVGVHSPEFEFEKNYANVNEYCPKIWNDLPCNSSWNGRKSYYNYYQA